MRISISVSLLGDVERDKNGSKISSDKKKSLRLFIVLDCICIV